MSRWCSRGSRDCVRLIVEDHGVGVNGSKGSRGFGMQSMKERAEAIGGHLEISRKPEGGTRVELIVKPWVARRASSQAAVSL